MTDHCIRSQLAFALVLSCSLIGAAQQSLAEVPTVEQAREVEPTATEILKEWKQATAQRRYVFVSGLRHDYDGAFERISKSKFVVMWESPGNGTLEILPPPDPGPGAALKTASDPGLKVEWERPSRWFWIDGMVVFVEETERRVWKCPINDLGWMQGLGVPLCGLAPFIAGPVGASSGEWEDEYDVSVLPSRPGDEGRYYRLCFVPKAEGGDIAQMKLLLRNSDLMPAVLKFEGRGFERYHLWWFEDVTVSDEETSVKRLQLPDLSGYRLEGSAEP